MPLYHFFLDAKRTPPRVGISRANPPMTGGTVIDTFVHDHGSLDELRKIAEERNSPLRIEWRDGVHWQGHDEEFGADPAGLETARRVASNVAAATGGARVVTKRGRVVWEWTGPGTLQR